MKQRFLVILFVCAAIVACKKTETVNNDTTGTTDTSSTTSTTSAAAATTLSADDTAFANEAAQGGMAEVNLGNLAGSKGTNADVKKFGDHMVTDHSKLNDQLKQLAASKGLTLPSDVGEANKKTMDELSAKSGADFDKAYIKDMVEDHEKDVKAFEKASKDAQDPDLKAWAAKALPIIQGHLKMAKEIAAKVK